MVKGLVIGIIFIVIILIGGYFLFTLGNTQKSVTSVQDQILSDSGQGIGSEDDHEHPSGTPEDHEHDEDNEIIIPPQPPQTQTIKEFTMTAEKWEFTPDTITVNEGDIVKLTIESIDVSHGFAISEFGINERLDPGNTVNVEFVASQKGTFSFFCSVQCGSGHSGMRGTLIVQ